MKTLDVLKRLRDHDKRRARLELVRAEKRHDQQLDRVERVNQRVVEARAETTEDAASLAIYHQFRVQMELLGRRERSFLDETGRVVNERRGEVATAVREAEVVALVIEAREEEAALQERRDEEKVLDQLALSAWLRKVA
ncbi:MAG TPA: hypothetical protein QGF58_16430 [Myxococcota bacterium]|nr:hypothetical protein [Myxococcota bacterium]